MAIPKTFAQWLKLNRREKGMTQEQLAEAAGLARTYVTVLESGRIHLPVVGTRNKLHQALGTSDDDLIDMGLLAYDDEMPGWYSPVQMRLAQSEREGDPSQIEWRDSEAQPVLEQIVLFALHRMEHWRRVRLIKRINEQYAPTSSGPDDVPF